MNLLKMYQEHDKTVERRKGLTADTGRPVTCQRGCSHCCNIAVMSLGMEVVPIAERVAPQWRELVPRLLADAKRYGDGTDLNLRAFHAQELPCVFLSPEKDCSIYDIRPPNCRYYMVVSDPSHCSTVTGDTRVASVRMDDVLTAFVFEEMKQPSRIMGPLPLLVLHELGRIMPGEKEIQEALAQLPDPVIWISNYLASDRE